jgi:Family of unknown function (DUF6152)
MNPLAEKNRASTPLAAAASPADVVAGGKSIPPIEGAFTTVKHNKSLVICAFTICLFIYGLPAFAHHGNAAYDLDNPITLKGTVREFIWSNPHVQIYFDVKNGDGAVAHWASETVSPGMLSRRGWTKTELKAGDEITITLGPAKSGAPVGFTLKVVLADGTVLQLGQGRDLPSAP